MKIKFEKYKQTLELAKSYYNSNPSDFNFEAFHKSENDKSEYHLAPDGSKLTIYNSGLKERFNSLMYRDRTHENYQLIDIDERNFLINSQKAIPCSRVYQNIHGNCFITPFVIPNGEPILFGCNLIEQVFSFDILFYDKFFAGIKDKGIFTQYLENICLSFIDNDWWNNDNSIIRRFVSYKSIFSFDERIGIFDKLNALSFLELLILVHLRKVEFNINTFLYVIFISKNFNGHQYFWKLKEYLSLTETSKVIINESELIDYFKDNVRNWDDFILFFGLNDFLESIDFKKIGILHFESGNSFNIPNKVVSKALNPIKERFRSIENELRLNKGFKIVGGFAQESILYQKLRDYFKDYSVTSQGSPEWLKPQRIDIYFPEFNIGIEYQGEQHYKAVDYFGGKEGFLLTQKRDLLKRRKCKQNNCILIEVLPNYDFNQLVKSISLAINKVKYS